MKIKTKIIKKIDKYDPRGKLDQSAKLCLGLMRVRHGLVLEHMERVALLSEAVALELKKDTKAAFFGGLLHDIGKLMLPAELFSGRNINAEEYEVVKEHARAGFEALKNLHLFSALCAGLHHALYSRGYGADTKFFPIHWNVGTVKKVLEISAIISICDFIDAFTHRATEIKDGSDKRSSDLRTMLLTKYPDDHLIINVALAKQKELEL